MKKTYFLPVFSLPLLLFFCKQKSNDAAIAAADELLLKRGRLISCGPADKQFGKTNFTITGSEAVQQDFNLAATLLHSFEYDEAEKAFAAVIDKDPACAMGYWGVAMANFHPLWTPPSEAELKKGAAALRHAKKLQTSKREEAYIDAIAAFYNAWETTDHRTRCLKFETGMEKVYTVYRDDKEAAVFYALALDAAADPSDKSFGKQKKAGRILQTLYPGQPNHPGIVHYLIHTYDSPELAQYGLEAARKYAAIAPSSAHALHMPSHIFTRLGLWDECIASNLVSVSSAQCYAQSAGIKGHWDEELHGLDYLVYAYLQKGEKDSAKKQWDYLKTIIEVHPANFKVAYAFAAIPSRYLLENRLWDEAAHLTITPTFFSWKAFPWQEAILRFTRCLGAAHTSDFKLAREELSALNRIHDTLVNQKDSYKAAQVDVQRKTAAAWVLLKEGKAGEALPLMQMAADAEDKTEKHPVTPGEVLPARELLADMLLQLNKTAEALKAYEAVLQKHPARLNAIKGASLAAKQTGDVQKGKQYGRQLPVAVHGTGSIVR